MNEIKFAYLEKSPHICPHNANEQYIQTLVARNEILRCVTLPCSYFKYFKKARCTQRAFFVFAL